MAVYFLQRYFNALRFGLKVDGSGGLLLYTLMFFVSACAVMGLVVYFLQRYFNVLYFGIEGWFCSELHFCYMPSVSPATPRPGSQITAHTSNKIASCS